jgi:acyl-coenzyme A thioesterase 9
MATSLFKNPIVHQLWTARQQAKTQMKKGSSSSSIGADTGTTTTTTAAAAAGQSPRSKSPAESFVEVSYRFSSDGLLRETYRNPWNRIRFGKLLEDLDALAGNIAFFHVNNIDNNSNNSDNIDDNTHVDKVNDSSSSNSTAESSYPVIVTASVDRIRVRHEERPTADIDQCLSGQVTWTGTSSMEIRMQCSDAINGTWLEAYVTFVTLDAVTHQPVRIPAIVPTNDAERIAYAAGAARALVKKNRLEHRQFYESVHEPAAALLQQATPLLTMPTLADRDAVLLKDTTMQNAMIAQPQVQNLHNRIFGGFLMRRAFELAFANAYMFGGTRPRFQEVDEVSFTAPVDIGDLLVFNSRILYYEDSKIHVEVEAWVTEPEKVTAKRSNQFYFTFAITETPKRTKVLPSNMDEARQIIVRMLREKEQEQEDIR